MTTHIASSANIQIQVGGTGATTVTFNGPTAIAGSAIGLTQAVFTALTSGTAGPQALQVISGTLANGLLTDTSGVAWTIVRNTDGSLKVTSSGGVPYLVLSGKCPDNVTGIQPTMFAQRDSIGVTAVPSGVYLGYPVTPID